MAAFRGADGSLGVRKEKLEASGRPGRGRVRSLRDGCHVCLRWRRAPRAPALTQLGRRLPGLWEPACPSRVPFGDGGGTGRREWLVPGGPSLTGLAW